MLQAPETEETIGFFCHIFVIGGISFGRGGHPALPSKPYELGSFVLEMTKLLATSDAEFNSSVGTGMGSKPSGKKQWLFLPFGNKFRFGRKGARD